MKRPMNQRGFLVLESGEIYDGFWRGGMPCAAELVFNTSHSGYEEIATDPSYFSQMVVMTAPMQGNYGVSVDSWESRQPWIKGFICLQIQQSKRDETWLRLLNTHGIPCLSDVDTRAITLRLRSAGTSWGALVNAENIESAKKLAMDLISKKKNIEKDWVYLVSRKEVEIRKGNNLKGPRVAVLDFGSKENILRELMLRCSEIKIFPARTTTQQIFEYHPDGILLTNGPGDPSEVQVAPQTVRELLGKKPIFGICMGHQILGLALGARTYKLRFGHRGSNHPIRDEILKSIYMTSQNHGYAIERDSLPPDVMVTQVNLNDQTVAGLFSEKRNCLGIQYHPESHPGPHEAVRLFDFFVNKMILMRGF